MMPTNVAARMTLAADPGSLQGAVAAGILGCGPGHPRHRRGVRAAARGTRRAGVARARRRSRSPARSRTAIHAAGDKVPGLRPSGAPAARPARRADPRARRRARRERAARRARARASATRSPRTWGKPLTMNVSMPIAAVLLDLGFPSATVKAIPLLARTAGLLAHLAEEQRAADRLPDGRRRRRRRSPTSRRRRRSDARARGRGAPVGRAARARRRDLPRAARLPLRALGVLPREARRRPGSRRPRTAGGLAEIARLPLTEKHELRRRTTAENPIGAHLCATPRRDRPHLLDERHDRHAELHPAHRRRPRQLGHGLGAQLRAPPASPPGQRIVSTYNAGPFVAGAALAAFDRIGLCHIPVGTGNTERLMLAIELLEPEAAVLTPSYAAYLDRVGGRARLRPAPARASSACSSRASRAAASRRSARSSRRAGARGSPRRWASATSASRSGASARSRTACTSARAASSTPS